MKLNFRIDFGYQYLYSRRHYHPQFVWDGTLTCEGGKITDTFLLDYPVIWFGPGYCARETKLLSPAWELRTKRGLGGVRFEAEADENAVFHLSTQTVSFDFTAKDILEKGRIEVPVGPKYLGCFAIVTRTGYYWFRQPLKAGEAALEPDEMGLPVHEWARMHTAWLAPGADLTWQITVPESTKDYSETLVHLVAMAANEFTADHETNARGEIPFELFCDGRSVAKFAYYFREHDRFMQILQDAWVRVSLPAGEHTLSLRNEHEELWVVLTRLITKQCEYTHGQLSLPPWALVGEELVGKVFAVRAEPITVQTPNGAITLDAVPGWNEFKFSVAQPGNAVFTAGTEATVEIIDAQEEADPVRVGYDMTVVPHDDNGFMDWLLDYTQRTRLGNYVVFRSHNGRVPSYLLERWGAFCRDHGIWVSAIFDFMGGELVRTSGKMFSDCGMHEYPGRVYATDPKEPYASADMKQAAEHYLAFLKEEIDKTHTVSKCMAFGDASGGIRYSFLAGADFVRAETMVGNTMTLLPQARPAAEALSKGRWGVHIAIQHHYQPYHETHLGQYFLSIMQPWMMGANTIYEEDSLFCLFKEERQAWDDLLTKGKRDMTRDFFKFIKTHPRKGQNKRNIAFLEGRWAAPFSGFICDVEQDPHYSVWGLFGNNAPEWGHGQPEKCRQVLDVLMPGCSTHPFRQHFEKRRFFFTGTPYGDFDCVPVEADSSYINHYRLLVNLGWNTMIDEDYNKLKDFVANGGVLLTGLPQFSTHTGREFLKDMADLALYNGGDLSELCGIRVLGRGEAYSGQWNAMNREQMPEPELSALPSDSPDEDGEPMLAEIELNGAEVLAWDAFTAKPMLVRKAFGKGYVYTFTEWAYAGHERFQRFSAAWLQKLAAESLPECYVEDASGEVFWTRWESEDATELMMLNTDWTEKGNIKQVTVHTATQTLPVSVQERTAVSVVCPKDGGTPEIRVYTL